MEEERSGEEVGEVEKRDREKEDEEDERGREEEGGEAKKRDWGKNMGKRMRMKVKGVRGEREMLDNTRINSSTPHKKQ